MIDFQCQDCGRDFHIAEEFAGKKSRCLSCGAVVEVPTGFSGVQSLTASGVAAVCDSCGAGGIYPGDVAERTCGVCGLITYQRRCPSCKGASEIPPQDTVPGVNKWMCPLCGRDSGRHRWQSAPLSEQRKFLTRELLDLYSTVGLSPAPVVSDPTRRRLDGEITRVSGISGAATGPCTLLFERDLVLLIIGSTANHWSIEYEEISGLQFAGPGVVSKTSGGGWIGGGFGLTGIIEGAAIASVLNKLTTKTTTSTESVISFHWDSCQLEFLHTAFTPSQLSELLAPVVARIESAHAAHEAQTSPVPSEDLKTCPDCAEQVRTAARKCRFCGYVFDGGEA